MPALHEVVVRPVVTEKSSAAYQAPKATASRSVNKVRFGRPVIVSLNES